MTTHLHPVDPWDALTESLLRTLAARAEAGPLVLTKADVGELVRDLTLEACALNDDDRFYERWDEVGLLLEAIEVIKTAFSNGRIG